MWYSLAKLIFLIIISRIFFLLVIVFIATWTLKTSQETLPTHLPLEWGLKERFFFFSITFLHKKSNVAEYILIFMEITLIFKSSYGNICPTVYLRMEYTTPILFLFYDLFIHDSPTFSHANVYPYSIVSHIRSLTTRGWVLKPLPGP